MGRTQTPAAPDAYREMRVQDVQDIKQWIECAGDNVHGFWLVFRRGSPRRRVRVLKATHSEQKARKKYEQTRAEMRQGFTALVRTPADFTAPDQAEIIAYTSEPMTRTRW